jgi:hypothetical protein
MVVGYPKERRVVNRPVDVIGVYWGRNVQVTHRVHMRSRSMLGFLRHVHTLLSWFYLTSTSLLASLFVLLSIRVLTPWDDFRLIQSPFHLLYSRVFIVNI